MIRNLFTVTACVVLMSGPALSQTTAPAPAENSRPAHGNQQGIVQACAGRGTRCTRG